MPFPSELRFCSFLKYSPRKRLPRGERSHRVMLAIKTDGIMGRWNVIEYSASQIRQSLESHRFLQEALSPTAILVPMPRSAPLRGQHSLWPALRICEALLAEGMGQSIRRVLVRDTAVRKAATAGPGERPNPTDHHDSILVRPALDAGGIQDLTVVDDVITRGSSFIGVTPRLQAAFPYATLRYFALLRPSDEDPFETTIDPVSGQITYQQDRLDRVP